jgi:hypothetical protein
MGKVKLLTCVHETAAKEIARLKNKTSGTTAISDIDLNRLLNLYRNTLYGYFEGEELITWACIRFGDLHGEKTWTVMGIFTKNFSEHFSFNREDFGLIMKTVFEKAEAEGYYSYVYSIATRLEKVYDRKWSTNKFLPPSNRYTREKLIEIPANTKAPEDWQSRLVGGIKPDNVSILRRSLKPEFRK